jgi:hypothetical protein
MRRSRRLALALLAPLLVLALAGCPKQTTIAKIKDDPGRYRDKDVALRGTVTQAFGALGQGVYELDDGTGRIWVLVEEGGVPRQGAKVETAGRVIAGATFLGRDYGTSLREKKHRTI